MGCERAERENVFIKQQGLWVTPLLWVQCFSCWHRWKFWQQIRPLSALLLMLSKLSAFRRLYCIYNTPQLSRSVLWGVLHIPLTWCKTDPHFSHRDVTWRNRDSALFLVSALGMPIPDLCTPGRVFSRLWEMFSPHCGLLMLVFSSTGGGATDKTHSLDNRYLQFS